MNITNTLRAARPALHGDHATINAAFEGSACAGSYAGYLVVAGGANELGGCIAPPPRRRGDVRMVTLQSRADHTMSFLVPMEAGEPSLHVLSRLHSEPAHDDTAPTVHRPLPRTPAQYLAAGDGWGQAAAVYSTLAGDQHPVCDGADGGAAGAAMYSAPTEADQNLYAGGGVNGSNRPVVETNGGAMYSAPNEAEQELYAGEHAGGGGSAQPRVGGNESRI